MSRGGDGTAAEDPDARLKRMRMRSWRRGMREVDLILGPFADARLAAMGAGELALYERLLAESDGELMAWLLGRSAPPAWAEAMVATIAGFAREQHMPR